MGKAKTIESKGDQRKGLVGGSMYGQDAQTQIRGSGTGNICHRTTGPLETLFHSTAGVAIGARMRRY